MPRDEPQRITTAPKSPADELRSRQRTYLLSMGIRSLCFVGAVITGILHVNWAWPLLIAGALVLPYIAVVMANAAHTKGDQFTLADSPYGRPELRGGRPTSGDERFGWDDPDDRNF